MSYDPFAPSSQRRNQYPYHDSADFNPYAGAAPPHASSNQGGPYKDDSQVNTHIAGQPDDPDFDPFKPPPKSTGDLRIWRQDHHGNLWMKGGRGRCVGRFCCCTIMVAVLLVVSILLTLAIFLRPPDIEFRGVSPAEGASGSAVESSTSDLKVNLGIGIDVRNPNFFSIGFKSITATVTYPINNTLIGGGTQKNIVFPSNSKTSFTFPFAIEYSTNKDPSGKILVDIAQKCGFVPGSAKQQLTVKYTLKLAVQILGVTVDPPISGNVNFDCPFSQSDIKPLVSSIPALSGILGGGGGA